MAKKAVRTGKKLEQLVADAYRALGARRVKHDVELAGHQIDVYVELETQDQSSHLIAVEAKDYADKVGIRVVEDFLVVVGHLRRERLIDEGVIISVTGFSRPARNAARTARIRLLELDDLQNIVARDLLKKHLASQAPSSSLHNNSLIASYMHEAVCAGLDMRQIPESNLGAMLECIVRHSIGQHCACLSPENEQVPSAEGFCRLLSYLGWYMFSEGTDSCDAKDAAVLVDEVLSGLNGGQYSGEQMLDWLADTPWLRKTSRGAFEFRDSYIINIFAAMELKRWFSRGLGSVVLLGRTGEPGYRLASDVARWQQVIIPLAGMLTQDGAVELLEFLLEERLVQLAGRCIAEGQPMPQPTVVRVTHELLTLLAGVGLQ